MTTDKLNTLHGLSLGDVVKCTDGREYEFIRMKQKKFIGKNRGQAYDIDARMFVELIRKAEKVPFDPNVLQEGELFYVLDNKQTATIYRFKYMINSNRVKAENPITGGSVTVPSTMVEGAVNDLIRNGGRR